ncbi:MAG TPA: TadE family protein [Dehalococcoidia bacterium]|jgi:Flp pilus assembly protein TadG|nr:TadE family protein [Dehalococcoidia bacterium]
MKRKLTRGEGAQSLVEFALIVPMLLILVFGIIDFGLGLRAYISVSSATREGARYASVGNPAGSFSSGGSGECNGTTTTTVVGKTCATLKGLDLNNVDDVGVTYPSGKAPGSSVVVEMDYEYKYITPVSRLVDFFSGGSIGDSLTISAQTDMRLE